MNIIKIMKDIIPLINCMCQIVVASTAVIALILTYRQFSGKAKVKLKAKTTFFIDENGNGEFVVAIRISIVNLGMAPAYISETGIQGSYGKRKWSYCTSIDPIVIKPGNIVHISGFFDYDTVEDRARLNDKVSVYAKCQLDKYWHDKEKIRYDEFKRSFENVQKSLPVHTQTHDYL